MSEKQDQEERLEQATSNFRQRLQELGLTSTRRDRTFARGASMQIAILRPMMRWVLVANLLASFVATGCTGEDASPSERTAVQLRIDPGAALILGTDKSVALSVIATDTDGKEFTPEAVRWSSSSEDVEMNAQGVAAARSETASAWVTASVFD